MRWSGFFKDERGNVVLAQAPNPPLWGFLVFRAAALVVREGDVHDGLSFLATASLFVWAYLEITDPASPFRRVLGAVVMAAIVVGAFA